MRYFLLFLSLFSVFVLAERKIPKENRVASTLQTIEQAIPAMYYTEAMDTEENSPLVIESDLVKPILAALDEFIKGTKKNSNDEIIIMRYHITDPRVFELLGKAIKKGINVKVVTHLQDSLDMKWGEGETETSEFARGVPKNNELGHAVTAMQAIGLEFNSAKNGIFSPPLKIKKGSNDRIPLQHDKSIMLVRKNAKDEVESCRLFAGTDNWATQFNAKKKAVPTRINRMFEFADPTLNLYEYEHARAVIEAFSQGQNINKIKSEKPLLVFFKKETFKGDKYDEKVDWIETAFTDGNYNLNDRIVEFLNTATSDPKQFKVEEHGFSEFAFTNKKVLEATKESMKANPDSTLFGLFEDNFVGLLGYGLGAAIGGYDILPPFGKIVHGYGEGLADRSKVYVNQWKIEGAVEDDLENLHLTRHLQHDKTYYCIVNVNGVRKMFVATRSFNLSNNFHNLESQSILWLDADSALAKAIVKTVKDTVTASPETKVPLEDAMFRSVLAALTGHSGLEVPLESSRSVAKLLFEKKFDEMDEQIEAIIKIKTSLKKKVKVGVSRERAKKFSDFVRWHATEMPGAYVKGKDIPLRRMLSVTSIILIPKMSPIVQYLLLKSLLWEPGIEEKAQRARVEKAWEILGIENTIPEDKKDFQMPDMSQLFENIYETTPHLIGGICSNDLSRYTGQNYWEEKEPPTEL